MVSEQVNTKKRAGISVNALYGQRICRLARCKQPFQPVRVDQIFCKPYHRQEYYNDIFREGKKAIERKEAKEQMKGVQAVTQNMTAQERLTALVETAEAVFSRQGSK